jgi:hypothetical protein
MGDQPVARPLHARRTAQMQNKLTQTSMPQVEFEPTIPLFEQPKSVHALDRAATVIGHGNECDGKVPRTRLHVVTSTEDVSFSGT